MIHIGKNRIFKSDLIGDDRRSEYKFRLLVRDKDGKESIRHADIVIDASRVYGNHNWLGDGGIPAIGEPSNRHRIAYRLEDVCGSDRNKYEAKKTLLVGDVYSAATTVSFFKRLIIGNASTSLIWVTKNKGIFPFVPVNEDVLPVRAKLAQEALGVTERGSENITWINSTTVEEIEYFDDTGSFVVSLNTEDEIKN